VPCQGLNLGDVIAKRPPLSDFVLRPTLNFRMDEALVMNHDSNMPLLHVVLHQPDIPQNTGNIGRSCVAVGAKLWLVRPLGFLMEDRYLKRAGMDYWDHVDCEVVDHWAELLQRLAETATSSRQFWFLTKFARKLAWEATFQKGDVLVFGSETRGLPEELRLANADTCLKLPMRETVRSLNLASTANTILYEAVRQFGGQV